ncbi:hypothetical protein ACFPER_04305 [Agromyces aurantiacus]|uniref:Uncharacterized protein n=1 Tax=Agromyces aurantiacus TaxID=165814 RepID=A0ABV9R1M5_9MICO|nr:hypothetical protein [Agromyces aurantiacus]MBM7502679.1 hypothetical protein [Agromyces aurantiacus]
MGRVRLVRGHGVQLVRWRAVEHGWAADVRRGRRLAEDAGGWTVLIGGREQRFERSEWTEFIGELTPPGGSPGSRQVRRVVPPSPTRPARETGPAPASAYPRSETLRDVPTTRPIMEPAPDEPHREDGRR